MEKLEKEYFLAKRLNGDFTDYCCQFVEMNRKRRTVLKPNLNKVFEEAQKDYKHLAWFAGNACIMSNNLYDVGFETTSGIYSDMYYNTKVKYFELFGENQDACAYWYKYID